MLKNTCNTFRVTSASYIGQVPTIMAVIVNITPALILLKQKLVDFPISDGTKLILTLQIYLPVQHIVMIVDDNLKKNHFYINCDAANLQ